MKKTLIILGFAVFLFSCETQKPLYSWEKYESKSYNYFKNSDQKSTQELLENYKLIIEHQKGSRNVPPPGICADYGFLLLQAGKTQEGKALLLKEVTLYPESKIFIDRILKMVDK